MRGCCADLHSAIRDIVADTALHKRSPVRLAARQKHHVGTARDRRRNTTAAAATTVSKQSERHASATVGDRSLHLSTSPNPPEINSLSFLHGDVDGSDPTLKRRRSDRHSESRHYKRRDIITTNINTAVVSAHTNTAPSSNTSTGVCAPASLSSILVLAALSTVYHTFTPPPSPRISVAHLQGRFPYHSQRRRSLSLSAMAVDTTEASIAEEGGIKGTGTSSSRDQDVTAKPVTTGTLFGIGLHDSLKYVSLVLLTLQNAMLILVMRFVRTREGDMFMATSAVIAAECLKFSACLVIIFFQEGASVRRFWGHMNENIFQQPLDCLKISVPSIVYTLQNNLLYVALTNLEAATFQVTYQLKILTTAVFSVFMLRKHLTKLQWLSLFFLFCGVSIVQLSGGKSTSHAATGQNPVVGLVAVIVSCIMSGFAGVYFEKILKGTKQTLWLRNVQLGFLGMVFGYITMEMNDGEQFHQKGFFFGYDYWVWIVICLQSFGGLMVAVVVKYADNILKGFATSAAIILSCVASIYLFDFELTLQFTFGATLVILSVYMYSKFVPKPSDGNSVPKGVSKV